MNMSDVYDEILNNSNIQTILQHYGLNVTRNKCNCPFHKDTNPSMSIHPSKGIVKCFACGAGGNAISFIQKYESEINHNQISIKQAMQKAIDIQGLNTIIPDNKSTALNKEQEKVNRLNNVLKDTIALNEQNLIEKNNEIQNVLMYLKKRKISEETMKQFHIGYTPMNRTYTTERMLKKYNINDLIEVGITKRNEHNQNVDTFYGRIMIPIFDANGNPVGFGARTVSENVKPKYINTTATALFNKSKILFNFHKAKFYAKNDEIIIVEGYMDVISAKEMKFDNVVGTMGTALTDEHIELIKTLKCEVTLCLDNDNAGKDAMIRIIPELIKANLKVNVLDISQIGNYKDFGDLQEANISREQIYKTKISAFVFFMKEKYIKDKELTVENIYSIYKKMSEDGLIKDTKDVLAFKEYIMNYTEYKMEEVEKIINPRVITNNDRVNRYKDIYFYYYIMNLIKSYAMKRQNRVLVKYVEDGKIDEKMLVESLDNEQFLKDDKVEINIGSYIREFIFKSEDYINFKNDKMFILDNLLNNVKSFDEKGNMIEIELTIKQKEMIIKQYNESFDSNIKEYIENNPEEFEEIFIANNYIQFEKLFPKTYVETLKEQAINRFKNDGVMEAVRYGLAYPESMKSAMNRQIVNNEKYKTLLVFNNTNNILELSAKNIKKTSHEQEKVKEEIESKEEKTETQIKTKNKSVFIKLVGNEKETSNGMYLQTEGDIQVFIPKYLYKKNDGKIELLDNNQGNMSEYKIDKEEHTKKWMSKLSLEDFYHKYFKMYEIQVENEVMV